MARTVTKLDVELAKAFMPILIDLAEKGETITYKKLIDDAKIKSPNNLALNGAIPVGTGRRLEVIRKYTDFIKAPDVTCLVVNAASQTCGEAYLQDYKVKKMRDELKKHTWVKNKSWIKYFDDLLV